MKAQAAGIVSMPSATKKTFSVPPPGGTTSAASAGWSSKMPLLTKAPAFWTAVTVSSGSAMTICQPAMGCVPWLTTCPGTRRTPDCPRDTGRHHVGGWAGVPRRPACRGGRRAAAASLPGGAAAALGRFGWWADGEHPRGLAGGGVLRPEHHGRHYQPGAGDRDDLSQSPNMGIAENVLRDIAADEDVNAAERDDVAEDRDDADGHRHLGPDGPGDVSDGRSGAGINTGELRRAARGWPLCRPSIFRR